MELLNWFYHLAIPLLGWWMLLTQFQKLTVKIKNHGDWGKNFLWDFLHSFFISLGHATPENHMIEIKASQLPLRIRLLWLGLRSLSYGFIFVVLFGIWNWVPTAVLLILGLVLFIGAQWWRPLQSLALFVLGLGLFIFGFENLLQASSQMTGETEAPIWVYELGANYFQGALLGVGLGALLRLVFRISGVAWWSGLSLLLGGILSLGGAWGFFLGEFLASAAEDWKRHKEVDFRWRCRLAFGFGLVLLFLSGPFQVLAMDWINGQYSVQIRSLQLGLMIFIFLALESLLSLIFFHFYFSKQKR